MWKLILTIIVILAISITAISLYRSAGKEIGNTNFKEDGAYQTQLGDLAKRYESAGDARRPVTELLTTDEAPPDYEQCLVNFYSLGCRFTGYLGPFNQGYFDPENAVLYAVKAGCRCFVLEVDYIDECDGETIKYFPRIVVRDSQNKMVIKPNSNKPLCNSPQFSNIRDVCQHINDKAFSSLAQNSSDPVIIVLYFLRKPPGSFKSKTVLNYYSNVARALEPLKDRLVQNELDGGSFYRQKQEGRLLINKITDYNGKALIFSNANTSGFREDKSYSPMEDLDYLVNLRLVYTQTQLGITENTSGGAGSYGILQTAEDYTVIPTDRVDEVAESTKLRWTICLSKDPSQPVSGDIYNKITSTYGVHCVPIQLFDSTNDFMFQDNTFKKYSFMPKPKELRYIKPPIVIPGEPNPKTDAKQGLLRAPTI